MLDIVQMAIDEAFENERREEARAYLGASIVGNDCDASLAFNLRGFPNTDPQPRQKRIFRDGHRIEDQVVADLRKAGFAVWDRDPMTGRQFEYSEFGGHVKCHTDGQIELDHRWPGAQAGDIALLEIKSMNDASWSKFNTYGVRVSHPSYYWQIQLMLGLSGIKSCVFVAYNKNTSEYRSEFVLFKDTDFAFLKSKIERVLQNNARKVSDDQSDWRCRGCFKRGACWGGALPAPSCRACAHAAADPDHGWWCMKHQTPAVAVCGDYQVYHPHPKQ